MVTQWLFQEMTNIPFSTTSLLAYIGPNNQVVGPSGAFETDGHLHPWATIVPHQQLHPASGQYLK